MLIISVLFDFLRIKVFAGYLTFSKAYWAFNIFASKQRNFNVKILSTSLLLLSWVLVIMLATSSFEVLSYISLAISLITVAMRRSILLEKIKPIVYIAITYGLYQILAYEFNFGTLEESFEFMRPLPVYNGRVRIKSFFSEPSYYAVFLNCIYVLFIDRKDQYFLRILLLVSLLLTYSLLGYFLFLVINLKFIWKYKIMIGVMVLLILNLTSNYDALLWLMQRVSLIFRFYEVGFAGSESYRMNLLLMPFGLGWQDLLFGLGTGNALDHYILSYSGIINTNIPSFFVDVILKFGLVGLSIMASLFHFIGKNLIYQKKVFLYFLPFFYGNLYTPLFWLYPILLMYASSSHNK